MRVLMLAQSVRPRRRRARSGWSRTSAPSCPAAGTTSRSRPCDQPGGRRREPWAGRGSTPSAARATASGPAREIERRHAPRSRPRDGPRPAPGARRGATRHRPCPQLDRPLLPAARPAERRRAGPLRARLRPPLRDQAPAAQGVPCSGPGPIKCVPAPGSTTGALRGPRRRRRRPGPRVEIAPHVDLFLPVSSVVDRFCRLSTSNSQVHAELHPRAAPLRPLRRPPRPAPDGPFILYFGDITEDKGVWNLAEAYADSRAAAAGPDRPQLPGRARRTPRCPRARPLAARARDRGPSPLPVHRRPLDLAGAIRPGRAGGGGRRQSRRSPRTSAGFPTSSSTARPGSWSRRVTAPRSARRCERLIDDEALRDRLGAAAIGRAADVRPRRRSSRSSKSAYELAIDRRASRCLG